MNLSCKEATRLMSQSQDRELSLGERAALKIHLAMCRGCRAVSEQLGFLRRAVRRLGDD
ncbi:MAG TPA: zf-HC2 domain-containing protein [Burkholderiales bacterium]|jgi:predicted anti-sigma-YlaC factor YlaD|nr:zf-HC2 domain-containing protein [Burkholderiales bacterium]